MPPPDKDFDFIPGTQGPHARHTKIHVPGQASGKTLTIRSNPLPSESVPTAPANKGIQGIIRWVIEPDIRDQNNDPVYDFDPPLTVSIDFQADDVQAAGGKPRLSIITMYKDGNTWKFERLNTMVTGSASGGTLTASVRNLHPRDPFALGFP